MRVDLAAQVSAASLVTLAHTWTLVILCVELVSLVNVSVITLLPTMVVTKYFDSRVEHGTCTTHDTPNGCGFVITMRENKGLHFSAFCFKCSKLNDSPEFLRSSVSQFQKHYSLLEGQTWKKPPSLLAHLTSSLMH